MGRDGAIRKFQAFVEREGETLGRLLSWAERRVLEDTLEGLAADGNRLTLAQISLMQQLCLGSSRLTEVARRMGLTKQAVGQIADGLQSKGLVQRSPDPDDSRAKVIVYTPKGLLVVDRLIDATLAVERTIAAEVGPEDLAALKSVLGRISKKTNSNPE